MDQRLAAIRAAGSPNYKQVLGAIANGVTVYYDLLSVWPQAWAFDYLDSMIVTNNSAQPIEVGVNGDTYAVLPYQIQPITHVPIRQWSVKNAGAAPTLASDITIMARLLPADTPVVVTTRQ